MKNLRFEIAMHQRTSKNSLVFGLSVFYLNCKKFVPTGIAVMPWKFNSHR